VANRLGVGVRHVRRLVQEGRIPFVKWGHPLRFDPLDIEELDRRQPQAAVPLTATERRAGLQVLSDDPRREGNRGEGRADREGRVLVVDLGVRHPGREQSSTTLTGTRVPRNRACPYTTEGSLSMRRVSATMTRIIALDSFEWPFGAGSRSPCGLLRPDVGDRIPTLTELRLDEPSPALLSVHLAATHRE